MECLIIGSRKVIGLGHTSDTMTALGHEKLIASGFNSLTYVHRRANYIHSASELLHCDGVQPLRLWNIVGVSLGSKQVK
jgi:hypothetical protein